MLGRFAVLVDGSPIPEAQWRLRKSRSVVKLLALAPGRALHPERVQELLWPQREPASASNNLRQAVYHARRALGCAGADGAALLSSFFFQAEDGIRDESVTGVQTCALPISPPTFPAPGPHPLAADKVGG